MHWGTAILSLEPIWEPPVRFKANAENLDIKKKKQLYLKLVKLKNLDELIN